MNTQINLDYAATTPMAAEAIIALANCLGIEGAYANPASLQHQLGEQAHLLVEQARNEIAGFLHCKQLIWFLLPAQPNQTIWRLKGLR